MIKNQLAATLRKPAVRIKFLIITLLFIPTLIEQSLIVMTYPSYRLGIEGHATVAIMLLEVFNYLYFYVEVLLLGYILLIPDIVRDEYVEKQSVILCSSRKRAAGTAIARIIGFTVLYVAWFVFLTAVISGIWLRDFSLEWPDFIRVMHKQVPPTNQWMEVIMLPEGCMDYPVLAVLILVLLRSMLGFIFLGLLAGLITLLTKKVKYGVGILIFLVGMTLFIYYDFAAGRIDYYNPSLPLTQARANIDLIKATIVPFFTFRSMTDDFTYWIRYGILSGLILCIITGIGVWLYYQKGDLGNADCDE